MKTKLLSAMESFAKAMVQPLSYISVAGMILVIGVLITNNAVMGILPFLKLQPFQLIGNFLYQCIMTIINNLGLVFAVGISAALAKSEKHQAALIALLSYLMFLIANNVTLTTFDMLATPSNMIGLYGTGQTTLLGVQVTDMGVFNGIILGCLCSYVFNKTSNKNFKGYWSMYSGTRFSFAFMVLVSILFGFLCTFIWPSIQEIIKLLTRLIAQSGEFGLFLYGMLERLLVPTGLHHLVYAPFQFGELGGSLSLGNQTIIGAYPIVLTELQMNKEFSDSIYFMGTGLAKTFGYIGICAAFYYTALPENKKKIKNTLIPLVLTASLSGITEPIDFLFAFVAPLLFLVHSIIAGIFLALLKILNIHAMSTGLINSFVMNLAAGVSKTNWPLFYALALIEIIVYFLVFVFLIKKLNLKTPGRIKDTNNKQIEINDEIIKKEIFSEEDIDNLIAGLGGVANILTLDNCFTRLRVNVNDANIIDENKIKLTRNSGIVKRGNDIQIIYGLEVSQIHKNIINRLKEINKR